MDPSNFAGVGNHFVAKVPAQAVLGSDGQMKISNDNCPTGGCTFFN